MSAATDIITDQVQPRAISLRWIINAREDLIWFVGSVASSYALLILYVTGVLPLIPMVAGWAILIDAPHVFGTLSRTYFDASEWKTRKRLLLGSLGFFIIGPVLVLLGAGLPFFFVAALWAYYHLVKQHYGFMVLYKKKNNDLAPVDNALDRVWSTPTDRNPDSPGSFGTGAKCGSFRNTHMAVDGGIIDMGIFQKTDGTIFVQFFGGSTTPPPTPEPTLAPPAQPTPPASPNPTTSSTPSNSPA